jgi:hypothetical protein
VPNLAIHTIGGVSGVMAASLGWTLFYAVCMVGALPGMLLMALLLRKEGRDVAPSNAGGPGAHTHDERRRLEQRV